MNKKLLTTMTILAVTGSILFTGCSQSENTTTTTAAETTASETTTETTQASASEDISQKDTDELRYKDFLEGQYKEKYAETLSNPIEDGEDTEGDKYTFCDLDDDGNSELLVGNYTNAVYLIVSEKDKTYSVTETYSIKPMGGICASEYLGNGCFIGTHTVPDNTCKTFFRYNGQTGSCDLLAVLKQALDSDKVTYELFKAKDDKTVEEYHAYNELNIDKSNDLYDYKTKTFESEGDNEISKAFSEYMSSYTKNNSNKVFDWKDL